MWKDGTRGPRKGFTDEVTSGSGTDDNLCEPTKIVPGEITILFINFDLVFTVLFTWRTFPLLRGVEI